MEIPQFKIVKVGENYALQITVLVETVISHTKESAPSPLSEVYQDEDLSPQECAVVLKCSVSTIYRRTRDLQLPYHRLGNQEHGPIFIKRSDLQKLKKSKRLNGVKY